MSAAIAFLSAVWRLLKNRWVQLGILAGLLVLAVLRSNHYERDRDAWKLAHAAQKAAMIAVSKEAEAKAIAAKLAAEAAYREKAKVSDERHQMALDSAERALQRYIERMRAEANRPSRGGPATPADSGGAAVASGSAGATELVAVSTDDLRICTANAVYAMEAHLWATGLVIENE